MKEHKAGGTADRVNPLIQRMLAEYLPSRKTKRQVPKNVSAVRKRRLARKRLKTLRRVRMARGQDPRTGS